MGSVNRHRQHIAYSRSERERSHYSEWEQDILAWIIEHGGADGAFVCTTQKQLSEDLGIARSSLNELFRYMQRIEKRAIAGRYGYTMLRLRKIKE